jgi:hypothetical protein
MRILRFTTVFLLMAGCPVAENPDDDTGDDDTGDDDTGDDDTGDDDTGDDDTGDDDTGDDDTGDDDTGDDDTEPPHPAEGRDFRRDLANATFTTPPGIGSLLAQYLADMHLILHVQDVDDGAGQIRMYGGSVEQVGNDYVQDLCVPTWSMTDDQPGEWNDQAFAIGPIDLEYTLEGGQGVTYDYETDGVIAPSGLVMFNGAVGGHVDTRVLDELLDPDAEVGAACALFMSLGMDCTPCPGSQEPYCLAIAAHGINAEEVSISGTHPQTGQSTTGLTEVTPDQVTGWENTGHCP